MLGLVIYGSELVLWLGVFVCGGYFNLIPWARKRIQDSQSAARDLPSREPTDGEAVATGRDEAESIASSESSRTVFRTASYNDDGSVAGRGPHSIILQQLA